MVVTIVGSSRLVSIGPAASIPNAASRVSPTCGTRYARTLDLGFVSSNRTK
jgi:hypothetical protein